jgi:GGDEF domain-containing protein
MDDTEAREPTPIRPASQDGVGEPAPATTFSQVVGQIQAERRGLIRMRIAFAFVVALWVAAAGWALPSIPFGITEGAGAQLTVALLFWTAASLGSLLFVFAWAPRFRDETLPEFLGVLFGGRQLIRGRQAFNRRLGAECQRARRDRRHAFSLAVIQHPQTEPNEGLKASTYRDALAAVLVRGVVRADDIVAQVGPDEVWALILGAGEPARERVAERVQHALRELGGSVRIGASSFGPDGTDAQTLVSVAFKRIASLESFSKIRLAA